MLVGSFKFSRDLKFDSVSYLQGFPVKFIELHIMGLFFLLSKFHKYTRIEEKTTLKVFSNI